MRRRLLPAALALLTASSLLAACSSAGDDVDLGLDDEPTAFDPECPGRGHLASEAEGRVRPGVQTPQSYSFLWVANDGCAPVRFNPCEPIPYVTNEAKAQPEDLEALRQAMAKVTEATGIEFEHEGTTDELPGRRGAYVERYGERWAPVLVAWVDEQQMEFFVGSAGGRTPGRGETTGTTVPVNHYPGAGSPRRVGDALVSGLLILNVDAVDPETGEPIDHGFDRGLNWGRVILHELGHVIGLGHVQSRSNIMQHELRRQTLSSVDWGIGDELALRAIGREAGCSDTPEFDPALA